MRLLVSLLVGLAQVAGPWLCCCVSARAAVPAATAAPVETCPHCKGKPTEPPADPAPRLPAPCPCGGKVVEPVVPAKADPLDPLAFDPPAAAFDAATFSRAAPVVSTAGVSDLPFLPPGTRLFVHHALRC